MKLTRQTLISSEKRYARDQKRKVVRTQTIFKEGDFVLIHNDHKKDKRDTEWLEPYRIHPVKTSYYEIIIDKVVKKIHGNRLDIFFRTFIVTTTLIYAKLGEGINFLPLEL